MEIVIAIIVCFIVNSLSLYAISKSVGDFFLYIFSKKWSTAKGKVIKSYLETIKDEGVFYKANIVYIYEAGNKKYKSDSICFGYSRSDSFSSHNKYVQMFPKDSEITIYYCSKKPEKSVIIPVLNKNVYITFIISLTMSVSTTLLFVLYLLFYVGT